MNATDLGPIVPYIRLDVARNLRAQSLEALQAAIADWWASAGAGEYHAVCRRNTFMLAPTFRPTAAIGIACGENGADARRTTTGVGWARRMAPGRN